MSIYLAFVGDEVRRDGIYLSVGRSSTEIKASRDLTTTCLHESICCETYLFVEDKDWGTLSLMKN